MKVSIQSTTELLFVGVAAGMTTATVVLAAKHVADVGDLLGFLGAFVGAVMTVGGAVWVEKAKESRSKREAFEIVGETINNLGESAFRVATKDPLITGTVQTLLQMTHAWRSVSMIHPIVNSNATPYLAMLNYWVGETVPVIERAIDSRDRAGKLNSGDIAELQIRGLNVAIVCNTVLQNLTIWDRKKFSSLDEKVRNTKPGSILSK